MTTTSTLLHDTTSKPASIASTVGWTLLGAGTIFVAGKLVTATGNALDLPYGCWQLTGIRAAASALVVGGLTSLRRGNLAMLGAMYAVLLPLSHSASSLLIVSAMLAGLAAFAVQRTVARRTWAIVLSAVAFNVVLTLSGLVSALQVDAAHRLGLPNYASGLCIRVLATLFVAGTIAWAARKK